MSALMASTVSFST